MTVKITLIFDTEDCSVKLNDESLCKLAHELGQILIDKGIPSTKNVVVSQMIERKVM